MNSASGMMMVGVLLAGVAGMAREARAAEAASLKNAFQGDFLVGTALGTRQIMGEEPQELALVAEQFNSITPENCLKWAEVHPKPDAYDFEASDRFVEWGQENGMFIVGHTLIWHNQTPPWAFAGTDDKPLDRETALARIKEHIETVVGRYKGRIHGWDVVNEAINDQGKLRTGPVGTWPNRGEPWHAAIGDDYIELAFRMAHAADPDAELYYNDFNEWYPTKIEAISELVMGLKAKGVRIDGLGLQGHWGLDYPTVEELDTMFTEYGKLGVKLMITELDVSCLPAPDAETGADITRIVSAGPEQNPFPDGLPPEKQAELAARYAELFELFRKHSDKIERVTFWGVHDGQSWRNNWPVRGRSDYPLLFDRELQPKSAFKAVIGTAKQ